jgi:hypothetical protein
VAVVASIVQQTFGRLDDGIRSTPSAVRQWRHEVLEVRAAGFGLSGKVQREGGVAPAEFGGLHEPLRAVDGEDEKSSARGSTTSLESRRSAAGMSHGTMSRPWAAHALEPTHGGPRIR